jgi:uncharacterized protein YjbI with pentapeptide repeats
MKNAKLGGANLLGAVVKETDFENADMAGANLKGVDLKTSHFGGTQVELDLDNFPPHLRRAFREHEQWIVSGGKEGERGALVEEDLSRINLSKRNLSGMLLKNVKLRSANLANSILILSDLSGSDLEGANLQGAMLIGTNLTDSNLTRADFTSAVVKATEVMNARGEPTGRIQKTLLDRANLAHALITGIDLTQCSTEGTKFG